MIHCEYTSNLVVWVYTGRLFVYFLAGLIVLSVCVGLYTTYFPFSLFSVSVCCDQYCYTLELTAYFTVLFGWELTSRVTYYKNSHLFRWIN